MATFIIRGFDRQHLVRPLPLPTGARRVAAIDRANERYGPWTVLPARMLGTEDEVQDRISFGAVAEIA